MKCPVCGAENSDATTFCSLCLRPFESAAGAAPRAHAGRPAPSAGVAGPPRDKRDTFASVVAGLTALAALFVVMLAPLFAAYFDAGLPLDGPGPAWGGWLLIVSGTLGAVVSFFVHNLVLVRVFGYREEDARLSFFDSSFLRRYAPAVRRRDRIGG